MPRTSEISLGLALASVSTASSVAFHQSAGSCSDQPGCGRTGSTALALASPSGLPAPSIRNAFTPEVPISMPR